MRKGDIVKVRAKVHTYYGYILHDFNSSWVSLVEGEEGENKKSLYRYDFPVPQTCIFLGWSYLAIGTYEKWDDEFGYDHARLRESKRCKVAVVSPAERGAQYEKSFRCLESDIVV